MNYVEIATRKSRKPKDEKAYLTVMEFLVQGYNFLEVISDLEGYGFYKYKLKQLIRAAEKQLMKEIDSHIGQLIGIDPKSTWEIIENRRTILKEICMMKPYEAEVVNDVLKVLTPENQKRIQKFIKTLKKQS